MKTLTMPVEVIAIQFTQETIIEAIIELQEELSSLGLGAIFEIDVDGNFYVYYGSKQAFKEENWKDQCAKLPIMENHGVLLYYWDMVECVDLKEFYERFPDEKKKKNKKAGK